MTENGLLYESSQKVICPLCNNEYDFLPSHLSLHVNQGDIESVNAYSKYLPREEKFSRYYLLELKRRSQESIPTFEHMQKVGSTQQQLRISILNQLIEDLNNQGMLSIDQCNNLTGIPKTTIYSAIAQGRLPLGCEVYPIMVAKDKVVKIQKNPLLGIGISDLIEFRKKHHSKYQ